MPSLALTFHHAGVSVGNLDEAIEWYSRALDCVVVRIGPIATVAGRVAVLRNGDAHFEIFEVTGAAPLKEDRRFPDRDLLSHGNKHVGFKVDDVATTKRLLESRGVEIVLDYPDLAFFIRDNSGNLIEFLSSSL